MKFPVDDIEVDDLLFCSSWVPNECDKLNPIKQDDIVYGRLDGIKQVFNSISDPCLLVTDSGDISLSKQDDQYIISTDFKFYRAFDSFPNNIRHWFSTSLDFYEDGFTLLPLGILGNHLKTMIDSVDYFRNLQKEHLLYVNFSPLNSNRRRKLINDIVNSNIPMGYFSTVGFPPNIKWPEYQKYLIGFYRKVVQSKFVLCPRGTGIDTFKIWETLYLGSIPVLEKSGFTEYFENYPVLVVDNFDTVTDDFLNEKFEEISNKTCNYDFLKKSYWLNKMKL